ncbi:MAG: DUF2063 domain-containing protein [Burkholderiales bacterium]
MRTPSLTELQDTFARGVFLDERGVLAWVESPATRFDIYRSSVISNLRNALRAVYPVVLRLTGQQFFDQAADQFVRESPSNSGDLHHYGNLFPTFLSTYAPARQLVYLEDVAHLEWLWHEAFHAANSTSPDFRALAQIPPADHDRLRFQLQPGYRLLSSPYPVLHIWEANQEGNTTVEETNLNDGPDRLIVYRAGFEVKIARLSVGEYAFVEMLGAGEMLGMAMTRAIEIEPGIDTGGSLKWLAVEGIIGGFVVA